MILSALPKLQKKKTRVVRCNNCGLYRLYPRMIRQGQIAMLKKYNDEEIDFTNRNPPLVPANGFSWEIKKLKHIFPSVFPKGRILDVGCAEGSFVAALKQAGANPTGIEPNEKLVTIGKDYGVDLRVGRFEAGGMPSDLKEHSFDLICFRESIYYMINLRETFDLIATYLRPDGLLYIKCHTPTSMYYFKNKDYSSRYGAYVAGMPTKKSLAYIFNHEGYAIIKIGYLPENVFHTLHWLSFEKYFIGKIAGIFLSLFIHAIARGDRIVVYASKIRGDTNERK